MTDRTPLDHLTSDQYDHLCDQLDALRQVARGYCPACGRGDAAPTVEHWERQKQRADEAEAKVADYENRITWHTTCESCARILDSSIRETERANEAEQRLRNIANGHPRADSIQAEIGEMILQTHDLRDQLRAAEEAARRALAQRQEMAEERYAWQERGDRAEAKLTAVAGLIADHEGDEWAAHPATTQLRAVLNGEQPGPA